MQMQSPTPLNKDAAIRFPRNFHVESLRGGMNRLLLRALPTADNPTRVEVLFQYVQYLQLPMQIDGLEICDVTSLEAEEPRFRALLHALPKARIFRLRSKSQSVGEVVAAACSFGEDVALSGSPSMFPMME